MHVEFITPSLSTCSLRLYDNKMVAEKVYSSYWHIHSEIEMILILAGTKIVYINDDEIQLNPGDIIFINSNIPHKTVTPIGSSCVLMQFKTTSQNDCTSDYTWLNNVASITNIPHKVFKKDTKINSTLADCIQKIRTEYANKEKSYDFFIKSYIYEIIAILFRNDVLTNYDKWQQRISPLIKVLKYVDEHYTEHISLSEISGVLNFHNAYFCKFFKNIMGISFVEYLNLVRLNNAKKLMKNTSKNITEISVEVGFSSVSYFIKTFKKYNHCSPNKYKSLL